MSLFRRFFVVLRNLVLFRGLLASLANYAQHVSQRSADWLHRIIHNPETFWLDTAITSILIGFGITLVLPFNVFGNATPWRAMAAVASEPYWGTLAISIGAAHSYALKRKDQQLVLITSFCTTCYFLFLCGGLIASGVFNPGISVYGLLTFWSAFVYLRKALP